MCPWPRFQSAMLDEQSLIVTYQGWRGEPRSHRRHDAQAHALGDCVDCNACVHVCPTGVDIREGVQLGCINCGLCADACNVVMDKMGTAPWLITWDTLAGQKARATGKHEKLHLIRTRTVIYMLALALGTGAVGYSLVTRATTTLSAIHDRAPVFVRLKDGGIRNGYTVKLANKTQLQAAYTLSLDGLRSAAISLPEQSPAFSTSVQLQVPADSVGTIRVLIEGTPNGTPDGKQEVTFTLVNQQSGETRRYRALFLSPPPAEGVQ